MSRTPAFAYMLYGLVAVALSVAPIMCARSIAARSALSQAADLYAQEPSCRRTARLPDPRTPIAASALSSSPCRLAGAMIVDTSYSGGPGGGSYALGLRDDAGVDRTVVLGGSADAGDFDRLKSGRRVIVQLDGERAMLIGDGVAQFQTRDNPSDAARQNAISIALFGGLTAVELIAVVAFLAGRRNAAP